MNARILALVAVLSLSTIACGGSDALMQPSSVDDVTAIHGLLRERTTGEFVEFATENFEALYDAETVRAPEWTVTGGTLMGNGNTARWQLPRAGSHTISLKVFLVDGRELNASWTVKVAARKSE